MLQGKVRDINTRRAITGVNVVIEQLQIGTVSNSAGRFSLKVLDPDPEMVVMFQHVGYDTLESTIEVILSNPTIYLQERVVPVAQITVSGQDNSLDNNVVAAAISIYENEKFDLRGYIDAGDLLKTDNSIQIDEQLSGKKTVSIRGGNSDEVIVLYNGFKLNRAFDNVFDLSLLNLSDVETFEIIKGSQTSLYGSEAFSGVVNVQPRSQPDYNIRVQQQFGSYDSGNWGLQLHERAGKMYGSLSLKRGGARRNYIGEEVGNRILENESEYQTATVGYNFSEDAAGDPKSTLGLAYLRANLDYKNERDAEELKTSSRMLTARYTGAIGKLDNLELSGAYQWLDENQFLRLREDSFLADSTSFLDRLLKNRAVHFNALREMSLAPFQLMVGYQFRNEKLSFRDERISLVSQVPTDPIDMRRYNHGFSSLLKLNIATNSRIVSRAHIDVSLRYDSVSDKFFESGERVENADLGAKWRASMLKFSTGMGGNTGTMAYNWFINFGRSVKFPSLLQQISSVNTFLVEENSTSLRSELNDGFELGFDITGNGASEGSFSGWKISGGFFRNLYRDKLRSYISPGTPVYTYENVDRADITGFETSEALYFFKKKMTLEFSASKYFFSDAETFPFKHDSKLTVNMHLDQAGYSLQLHAFREGEQIGLLRNIDEAIKIPSYSNVDLHFSKAFEPSSRLKLILNLSARNLLDDEFQIENLALRDRRYYVTLGVQY